MSRAALVLGLLVGAVVVGCGNDPELIVYPADAPELAAASVSAEGVWESAPWSDATWLPYPPRATTQIEHTLGRAPRVVLVYLSFDPGGTDAGLAAGDLARIVDVDATTLTFRNDTNGSYFIRVVAY